MKSFKRMSYILLSLLINPLHAGEQQITITPTTPTRLTLNTPSLVTYQITNHSDLRTFTMQPIPGVNQITTGEDACQPSFSLNHEESCFLYLSINTTKPLNLGPKICSDNEHTNECTQPQETDRLTTLPERTNGAVACWGSNNYGQLGNPTNSGTLNPNNKPLLVSTLSTGVTSITGGMNHQCALLTTGGVKCWGKNSKGQLGSTTNSGTSNPNHTPLPVQILTSGVTAITAGNTHTCARLGNGAVRCWGLNQYGQLGNISNSGTANPNNTPLPVQTLEAGVTAITGGENHTCALLTTGAVTCWGSNRFGQLGHTTNSGTNNPNNKPQTVSTLNSKVTAIAAGANHTCALRSGGAVYCWGINASGQLGSTQNSGTNNPNHYPLPVQILSSGVTAITAGGNHSCALLTNGGIKCWGSNHYGQLGNTTNSGTMNPNNIPLPVQTLSSGVKGISVGQYHSCALTTALGIKCWGLNEAGQLGSTQNSGTLNPNTIPSPVQTLSSGVIGILNHNIGNSSCAIF